MPRRPNVKPVSFHPENACDPFSLYAAEGWWLEVECWSCQDATYIAGADLVARFGAHASSGSIYPRLRCAKCRAGLPAIRAVKLPG